MIRKMFNRLSFKVFLISFIVQFLSGFLICFVLYSKTPEMMYSPRDELDDLIETLAHTPRAKGGMLIDDFIERTGMDIAIYIQEDYINGAYNTPVNTIGRRSLKSMEEVNKAMDKLDDNSYFGSYAIAFTDDDTDYMLQYYDYGEKHNLIPRALAGSYKQIILILTLISLVSSFIYAYLFAGPVRQLSLVSQKMADMDFDARCNTKRHDEIGDLARNLNAMSSALNQKIKELEDEITRVRELENQKEMFFAAASHELKTPVTVLEGHIRGMIEGIEPYEDHDTYLSKSLRTVKQIEALINEILTASRMQSSDEMVKTTVNMSDVLNTKLLQAEDLFTVKNITVKKNIASDLFFEGNAELTALAVGAFISNAVLYSKEGSEIEIASVKNGNYIVTSIRNKGAHIDEKDLPHLFEPFYRADSSRTGRSGGSGLGLYLANLIITKQGGTASLTNEPDGVAAEIKLISI